MPEQVSWRHGHARHRLPPNDNPLFRIRQRRARRHVRRGAGKNVAAYRSGAPVTIVLSGHADRAGPAPYNRALIEQGIPMQLISQFVFGEERPQIVTTDGVPEARNRRVKIRFANLNNL